MGFKVNPHLILFSSNFFSLVAVIIFTLLLKAIESEIQTLATVMVVISCSEVVAYILKHVQTHFDIKVLAETTP